MLTACGGSDPAPTLAISSPVPVLEATLTEGEPTATSAAAATVTAPVAAATATQPARSTPTVPATPTRTAAPTASATPTLEPTATATLVPPTATVSEGSVAIIGIDYDPAVGRDGDGETVTIQNNGAGAVDMTGWALSDIAEHLYVFPAFVLQPGATVVIHICSGADSADILFWGRCSAIWNNDGDTAYLRDATGRDISTFSY